MSTQIRQERNKLRVLGVSAAQGSLWLCTVGENGPEENDPTSITLLQGPAAGHAMKAFHGECTRLLSRLAPDRVVILEPEPTARLTLSDARERFAAEAVLALAADEGGIDCERIARATVRAQFGLARTGGLKNHVKSVFSEGVGKSWTGKRDLAALAASAVMESLRADSR